MSTHIENHHPKHYSTLTTLMQNQPNAPSRQPSDTELSEHDVPVKRKRVGPLDIAFPQPIKKGTSKWTVVTDSITNYLVGAMAPIRTVELQSFKKMIHTLEPGYEVPSRKYFSESAIPKAYNSKVEMVRREISGGIHYSMTTDAWTSAVNLNPYVSITIHFISDSFQYTTRNLATVYAPEDHTGKLKLLIRSAVLSTLSNRQIDMHCICRGKSCPDMERCPE